MANLNKKALKIIKKGFSFREWETFPAELKENEFIILELVKLLRNVSDDKLKELCDDNVYLIKYLPFEKQLELINNDNFRYLSEELQAEIINQNEQKVKYASEDIQLGWATKNPVKLSYLDLNLQKKLVDSNEFFLEFASKDVQMNCVKEKEDLLCRCSNLIQCAFVKSNPNYYVKCSSDVKRDIIKLSQLSLEEISIETLEHYMSVKYDKLSIDELKKCVEQLSVSNRDDKVQIMDYLNYLIVNIEKKKI